jgi:hypothetical protein
MAMKKFTKFLSLFLLAAIIMNTIPVITASAANPYLPLWEKTPDGEPKVFEDPDNPGRYRMYLYSSHDTYQYAYCGADIKCWSAPVEDLNDWRDEGPVFQYRPNASSNWDRFFAPDVVELKRFDPEVIARGRTPEDERTIVEYYLYPHSRASGRLGMVAKGPTPVGPFTPVNTTGGISGFDPSVLVDYVDDPNDPDYDIGFRAYIYYGGGGSGVYATVAELSQSNMYAIRPQTTPSVPGQGSAIQHYIPSSSSYGNLVSGSPSTWPYLVDPDHDRLAFNFFEASSVRKVGNKYIAVFSGYSGPDYGLGSTGSALRYCYGDSPLGPWKAGGVIVDSGAPVLNQAGSGLMLSSWRHNTHGGMVEINGQWYITYHRCPRGSLRTGWSTAYNPYSTGSNTERQAMVAPIKVEIDEAPVSEGGKVTIRAYDPYAQDEIWTAKASNGNEYTGAEVTSEGFNIFGLAPYAYYSAGYACFTLTGSNTVPTETASPYYMELPARSYDMWDNHQPLNGVQNGHKIGYKYFGFGGLDTPTKGINPFEGTAPGNNTKFNLWLTPRTESAFTVQVWLDGPWAGGAWNGTQIGAIDVPAGAAQTPARFSIDVSDAVDGLDGKRAIFLVVSGGTGTLCDIIGLGFSSDNHVIERHVPPEISISVDGTAQTIPVLPISSNGHYATGALATSTSNSNGISDFTRYQVSTSRPSGTPVITAAASDPSVKIMITQAPASGAGLVRFIYNGVMKKYWLFSLFTNIAATEPGEADANAILQADRTIGSSLRLLKLGATPAETISLSLEKIDDLITGLGVTPALTHIDGDLYTLTLSRNDTTLTVQNFNIRAADNLSVSGKIDILSLEGRLTFIAKEDVTLTMILAEYSPITLASVATQTFTFAAGEEREIEPPATPHAAHVYKLFFWESGSFTPLSTPLTDNG